MAKPVAQWTDARLDDLAAALGPVPAEVAALRAAVEHLNHLGAELEPMPIRLAVISATVDRLSDDNRALREMVAAGPEATIVLGDMNIAPTDDDVFDPDAYVGQTHVTEPERAALAELQALGLRDVVRDRWPGERVFTYWDYRAGMFHQDLGMRIDLVLASAPVADRVKAAWVDRHARKGSGPSDHAPVIVDLDEAPDGDIGPVVPPPSAPVTKRGAKRLPQAPPAP